VAFVVLNNVFGFYLRAFPVTTVSGVAGSLIFCVVDFVIAEVLIYGLIFLSVMRRLWVHMPTGQRDLRSFGSVCVGELAEATDLAVAQKEESVSNVGVKRAEAAN
jgi:uncharacterized BrkB/YihY/UPF0761 family membrane protein